MTRLKASNNATTRLVADVTATDTFFDVEDASPFPDPPFRVWVNEEIIEVGSIDRVANRFSDLVRAVENTTPAFHPVGSFVENVFTAGTYQELVDAINSKETPEGAQQKADTAESNAKAYADQKAGQAESNAKVYADQKAATAEANAKAYTDQKAGNYINSIAVYDSGNIDPNTTTDSYILTQHSNSPGGGIFWHILTFFYNSKTGNRAQIAQRYSGGDELYIRQHYNGSWSPWKRIWHDSNQPKITVSSTAPSNPKYGDIWIEP